MDILPRANEVVIPIRKFTEYALSSKKDPDKTIAFKRALGYNKSNVDKLIENIRQNLPNFPAIYKGNKGFGSVYEVVMELTGENGKKAKILTGWVDDAQNGEMRLTTVHIDD